MLIRAKQYISHFKLACIITDSVTYADHAPVHGAKFTGVEGLIWTIEAEDADDTQLVKGDEHAFKTNRYSLEDAEVGAVLVYVLDEIGKTVIQHWEKSDDFSWLLVMEHITGSLVPESENNSWNMKEQELLLAEKAERRNRLEKQAEVFKAADNRFAALKVLKD